MSVSIKSKVQHAADASRVGQQRSRDKKLCGQGRMKMHGHTHPAPLTHQAWWHVRPAFSRLIALPACTEPSAGNRHWALLLTESVSLNVSAWEASDNTSDHFLPRIAFILVCAARLRSDRGLGLSLFSRHAAEMCMSFARPAAATSWCQACTSMDAALDGAGFKRPRSMAEEVTGYVNRRAAGGEC